MESDINPSQFNSRMSLSRHRERQRDRARTRRAASRQVCSTKFSCARVASLFRRCYACEATEKHHYAPDAGDFGAGYFARPSRIRRVDSSATGAGAEVQRPLATVVIGGILSSTFLTLVFRCCMRGLNDSDSHDDLSRKTLSVAKDKPKKPNSSNCAAHSSTNEIRLRADAPQPSAEE